MWFAALQKHDNRRFPRPIPSADANAEHRRIVFQRRKVTGFDDFGASDRGLRRKSLNRLGIRPHVGAQIPDTGDNRMLAPSTMLGSA